MQVYCDFYSCLYNEDGYCDKEKIFLDSNGVCESCVFNEKQENDSNDD